LACELELKSARLHECLAEELTGDLEVAQSVADAQILKTAASSLKAKLLVDLEAGKRTKELHRTFK